MRIYRIVVGTFESASYPIVTHVFQGKDKEQAQAFVRAHESSDAFFRECATGLFAGKVRCTNRQLFSGWVDL